MGLARQLVLLCVLFACGPTAAREDEAIKVFTQLSADYTDCFIYHLIFKQCATGTANSMGLTIAQLSERLRCAECGGPLHSVKPWRQTDASGRRWGRSGR